MQRSHSVCSQVGACVAISQCLQRRSVAAEMGGLMSYETHERLHRLLLNALTEKPFDPGFVQPSADRVRNTDKWIWNKISSMCGKGLKHYFGVLLIDVWLS